MTDAPADAPATPGAPVDVSILIVSYNTREWLRACLDSVRRETTGVAYEVVVVDNASTDGSADTVRREHPEVRLIEAGGNLGFARGVNLAAAAAGGEYLLLLNPDTIVHDGAVQRLVAFARARPHHGVYGGRTLTPDGRLDPRSCWGLPTPYSLLCFATGLSTAFSGSRVLDPESLGPWRRDSVREVGMVSGGLLLLPRTLWHRLGGFDPAFFMYGEDADLCLRARRLGCRPVVTPDATITHAVGAATRQRADKTVLVMKGKATLVRRRWSPAARRFGVAMLLTGVALRAGLLRLLPGRSSPTGQDAGWAEVWRRRAEWWDGYPDPDPQPGPQPGTPVGPVTGVEDAARCGSGRPAR